MRWFVEVSRVGDATAAERYCVEAKAWQAALQEARKLRGDAGPLSKFSIELLDDGYRAVDPVQKIRYLVNQAPADAPIAAAVLNAPNGSAHAGAAAHATETAVKPPASEAASSPPMSPALTAPAAAPTARTPTAAVSNAPAAVAPAPVAPMAAAPAPVAPMAAAPAIAPAPATAAGASSAQASAGLPAAARPSVPRPGASKPPPELLGTGAPLVMPKAAALPTIEPARELEPVKSPLAGAGSPAANGSASALHAKLVEGAQAPGTASAPAFPAPPPAIFDAATAPSPEPPAVATVAAPAAAVAPPPAGAVSSDVATLPGPTVAPIVSEVLALRDGSTLGYQTLRSRTEEPSPEAPITYRETAYAVAPGVSREAVEALLRDRWAAVKSELSSRPPGQLVQLAVFDHVFDQRPLHAPLGTLAWKDWRGEPLVGFPGFGEAGPPVSTSVMPPPVTSQAAAGPAPAPQSEGVSAVTPLPSGELAPAAEARDEPPRPAEASAANGAAAEQRAEAPKAVSESVAPGKAERASRPRLAIARRRIGEDLIGELFELMHELHFARDIAIGADFLQGVLAEFLPTDIAILQVFDINKRQFVVVRARGGGAERAILHRTADNDPLLVEIMRRPGARVLKASDDGRFRAGRWSVVSAPVGDVLCGPVRQGGRYLGMIEIANPLGGTPFHESEINAFDYLCGQFAEFIASRPIVLDADVILPK